MSSTQSLSQMNHLLLHPLDLSHCPSCPSVQTSSAMSEHWIVVSTMCQLEKHVNIPLITCTKHPGCEGMYFCQKVPTYQANTCSPCLVAFYFITPYQYTPLLNLHPLIYGLMPFCCLQSIVLTPSPPLFLMRISYLIHMFLIFTHFFRNTTGSYTLTLSLPTSVSFVHDTPHRHTMDMNFIQQTTSL